MTNGKINNICGDDFSIVIAVVSSFKGVWKDKFSEFTENRPFLNSNGTTVLVETMNQIFLSKKYFKDENVEIISLPYKANKIDLNMIIILPNITKYSSPLDYLKKENVSFSEIYSKLEDKENIHLYLPKFTINYQIVITNILKEMGFKSVYDYNIANNLVKGSSLRFGGTLAANYVEVDEKGAEAGDVNIKDNSFDSNENKENIVMDVNHNFIFMVQSNQIKDSEGNYLMPFIGIVNKLEGSKNYNSTDKAESTDKGESTDINITTNKVDSTDGYITNDKDESTEGNISTDKDEPADGNISTDKDQSTDKDESTDLNISTDKDESTDKNIITDKDESTDKNIITDKDESTDKNITTDDEPIKIKIGLSNYFKINLIIIILLLILFL